MGHVPGRAATPRSAYPTHKHGCRPSRSLQRRTRRAGLPHPAQDIPAGHDFSKRPLCRLFPDTQNPCAGRKPCGKLCAGGSVKEFFFTGARFHWCPSDPPARHLLQHPSHARHAQADQRGTAAQPLTHTRKPGRQHHLWQMRNDTQRHAKRPAQPPDARMATVQIERLTRQPQPFLLQRSLV